MKRALSATLEGRVEVWAEGEVSPLKAFIFDLKRGPSGCREDQCNIQWKPYKKQYDQFGVL